MLSKMMTVLIFVFFIFLASEDAIAQSESLAWQDFTKATQKADEEGKTLFLFFEAEWCGFCKQMRSEVFPLADVQQKFDEGFIPVSIDIESGQKLIYQGKELSEQAFSHQLRIDATPTLMFMNSEGGVIGRYRGFADENEFTLLLDYIRDGEVKNLSFAEYKKKILNEGKK